MIDALVFPDTREVLFDLIDGAQHLGKPVRVVYQLPADSYGALKGPFPLALVYSGGGTRGFVDQVDRATIELYAPGQQAVSTLVSISASIIGTDIDTPSGFIDSIEADITSADVPYQSDTLNKAVATFLVTSRPI
ncbi:hypothetical protein [Arthrobacter sp. MA-N2]|uniref:hypothetical protein n=1 Tax=Arthrobacter sp. MA-N2 TaxID=1101188 RepID=UPI000483FAC9|nr:hypothetical protein [Arthrobacter sp. MA-N2]